MTDELVEALPVSDFIRAFPIGDMTVAQDGDGRTVTAFAAVFNRQQEITDLQGHYREVIAPASFNRTLAHRGKNVGVLYNHGRTLHGTPSEMGSIPIGVPVEAPRVATVGGVEGVLTVTRYLDNPLADSILDGIKQKAIPGQSFSGRWVKSSRTKGASRSDLPLVTRQEIDMKEYGPTPFPMYPEAAILGTRSVSLFLDEIAQADPEDVERMRQLLGMATPLDPAAQEGTPEGLAQATDPPDGHSASRSHQHSRLRAREIGAL